MFRKYNLSDLWTIPFVDLLQALSQHYGDASQKEHAGKREL